MIEGADVIAGAVVLLAGMGIGAGGTQLVYRLLGRTGSQAALPARPMCSCGHPPSVHDPQTKRCHTQVLTKYTDYGSKKLIQCPCRQYDGPEPLPEYYAPEIAP